jgi:hypothetical protein
MKGDDFMSALSWTLPAGISFPWLSAGPDLFWNPAGRRPSGAGTDSAAAFTGADTFMADSHLEASNVCRKGIQAALQTGLLQRRDGAAGAVGSAGASEARDQPSACTASQQDDDSEAEEALVSMFVERQKSAAKILKMLYDMQTDIFEMIGNAAVRRFKVMEDLAEKWAKALRDDG